MNSNRVLIERHLGEPLAGKRILEIGPGQLLKNARYFGAQNEVTALDLDAIASSWDFRVLVDILRQNGGLRFAKTLGRKALGIDRAFVREMERQMPSSANAKIKVFRGDVMNADLGSEFDCVMSYSVFEHLPKPAEAFRRISQLLRPGGVSFHVLHCFTSDSGAHDVRSYFEERSDFPYWAHLRPQFSHLVNSNAYINRLRVKEWKKIIADELPGAETTDVHQGQVPSLVRELKTLRKQGELTDYSDDELMTAAIIVVWRKEH